MNFASIIGFVAALGLIAYGMMSGGNSLDIFLDVGGLAITIGGTLGALMISFPFSMFAAIPKHFKILVAKNKYNPYKYIEQITDLAQEARKKGLLALEDKANECKDPFLKNSIMLIVDAIEPAKVKAILENEMSFLEDRHDYARSFYEKGAAYAPGFGMIGTLIGLVQMLQELTDQEALAGGMAVALLTTFYGSLMANVIFLPIAARMEIVGNEEMICKKIIVDGIVSIQAGENPRHIEERLLSSLPESMRAKYAGSSGKGGEDEGGDGKKAKKGKKK